MVGVVKSAAQPISRIELAPLLQSRKRRGVRFYAIIPILIAIWSKQTNADHKLAKMGCSMVTSGRSVGRGVKESAGGSPVPGSVPGRVKPSDIRSSRAWHPYGGAVVVAVII